MPTHRYKVGELVYFGFRGEKSGRILELVRSETASDPIGYELDGEGFLFESSVACSETEINKCLGRTTSE